MNASAAQAVLIYTHLPRTAGTTLNGILHREYGEQFYKVADGLAIEHGAMTVGREPFLGAPGRCATVVPRDRGAHGFGIHAWVPGPARYITVLRDPVDRVISLYHYIAETPTHRLHRNVTVEGWTLDDCLGNDPGRCSSTTTVSSGC